MDFEAVLSCAFKAFHADAAYALKNLPNKVREYSKTGFEEAQAALWRADHAEHTDSCAEIYSEFQFVFGELHIKGQPFIDHFLNFSFMWLRKFT